ncbi:MAG: hypothetical protein A3C80_00070 [Candidatus Ryanbacteria bacterium RIFCSPHIGHO2_02_FULL_45_43]|uniref:Uncharacterized protein n=1 Tax=Candidatus Ryanbacteria bacterium RIFCSPHIGHO2_01_45_13 TaxID=1802112 RepID=A0A1G2FVI0_9BACT|nr:MAG: hypothetical protein A2718_01455 [Candidatus Ryanbacteria bacterium RIFCSPHIGHO2_01_FULL_44_130]OGZ41817.1 MAG: hypothetical protein A2W41_00805 [Candidatus Ryanbacteria bacterium RIFCSPHIGHO2_01_45_13]OGZ47683.1 MAG: hypothetical protein A3C80_00070 [Candidatus Ryanbacteria bacterium RIFCSPHIGHO2_02_FULL_45_43]OGZ49580.1 MAG: hypothetical protein A3E55_04075 [Candidatus Ryanbacteria bacterium RIFCSPHIGHO2_12_FULL_44_20]OGZ51262.1 MAG: hypothetical protein A3A17_04400 [Candidatus Ryanba
MKKILYIGVVVVLLTAGIAFMYSALPVAMVDGERILYRDFRRYIHAVERFEKSSEVFGELIPSGFKFAELSDKELSRAVLTQLITDKVLADALEHEFDPTVKKDLTLYLQEVIGGKDTAALQTASRQIFGLNFNMLNRMILLPKARENVLRSVVETQGAHYNEWVADHLTAATVRVYFLPYRWQNGTLVDK